MQVEGHRAWRHVPATGARVSNAYPTWPHLWDSPLKRGLIPDAVPSKILYGTKAARRVWMGMRPIRKLAGQRPTNPTMGRGSERKVPHIGTETRSKLLREAAVRNIGQWPEG